MEAASKKRGRPKVIPESYAAVVAIAAEQGCTERQRQNVYYRQVAMSRLLPLGPDFEWLLPTGGNWKPGIDLPVDRILA